MVADRQGVPTGMVEVEHDIGRGLSFHPQDMEASVVAAFPVMAVAAGRRRRRSQRDPRSCHQECEHRAEYECPTHGKLLLSGQKVGARRGAGASGRTHAGSRPTLRLPVADAKLDAAAVQRAVSTECPRCRSAGEEHAVAGATDLTPAAVGARCVGAEGEAELLACEPPSECAERSPGTPPCRWAARGAGSAPLERAGGPPLRGSSATPESVGPKNWKESMTGTSCASSTARRPSWLMRSAPVGRNRPEQPGREHAAVEVVDLLCRRPVPGTNRSTQMNANVPNRRVPVPST